MSFIEDAEKVRSDEFNFENQAFRIGGFIPQLKISSKNERERVVFLNFGKQAEHFKDRTRWELGKYYYFQAHNAVKLENQKFASWTPCISAVSSGSCFCHVCYGNTDGYLSHFYAFPVYSINKGKYGYLFLNKTQLGSFADFFTEKKVRPEDHGAPYVSLYRQTGENNRVSYDMDFYNPSEDEVRDVWSDEHIVGLKKLFFVRGLRRYAEKSVKITLEYNYKKLYNKALEDPAMNNRRMDCILNEDNEVVGIPKSEEERSLEGMVQSSPSNYTAPSAPAPATPTSNPPPVNNSSHSDARSSRVGEEDEDPFEDKEDGPTPF